MFAFLVVPNIDGPACARQRGFATVKKVDVPSAKNIPFVGLKRLRDQDQNNNTNFMTQARFTDINFLYLMLTTLCHFVQVRVMVD